MTMEKLHRRDTDLAAEPSRAPAAAPGKRTITSSLSGRSQIVFRVESAEAAAVFADRFGPRDANGVAGGADAAVDRAAGSSGSPLPDDLRGRFESSLGADLSGVRIHTGSESAEASRAVGARAYTTGQDIHFGAGHYDPSSAFGVHLIAHEVAHTVQQQGASPSMQHKLEVSTPQDASEVEADRAADAMVAGASFSVQPSSGLARQTIQRDQDGARGNGAGVDEPQWSDEHPEPVECKPPPREELRWDFAGGGGEITAPWTDSPKFQPVERDCYETEADRTDKATFASDWAELQGSWNSAVKPMQEYALRSAQADAMLNETDLAAAGKGDPTQDKLADAKQNGSGRRLGDSFEDGGMKTDPSSLLISDDLTEAQRNDMAKLRTELKETVNGKDGTIAAQNAVKKAANDHASAADRVTQGLNRITIAKNDLSEKETQTAQEEMAIQRDEWLGVIRSMTSLTKMIASGETDGGVEAMGGLIETSATKQYNITIQEMKSKCNALTVTSKNKEVQNAMLEAEILKRELLNSIDVIQDASNHYEAALAARRAKYREMSTAVKDLAIEHGASDEDAGRLQIALQAIPIIELVLPTIVECEAALTVPGYTESSGRGAGLATNAMAMRMSYGVMEWNARQMSERRVSWQTRLDQLKTFVDSL